MMTTAGASDLTDLNTLATCDSSPEYTVGVSGCGKRAVYLTICRDAENCNALGDSARIDESAK